MGKSLAWRRGISVGRSYAVVGWLCSAFRVPDAFNNVAGGILRWAFHDVQAISLFCSLISVGRSTTWGKKVILSVPLVRPRARPNAIARSSERTYQEHFSALAEFRLGTRNCYFPVFWILHLNKVWPSLEHAAYVCMTRELQAKTVENHLSAVKRKYYQRVSRGCELQKHTPVAGESPERGDT